MNNPCGQGCTDRSATCHATCEAYRAFCEENALRRQERSACAAHERELNEQDFRHRTGRRSRKRAR